MVRLLTVLLILCSLVGCATQKAVKPCNAPVAVIEVRNG